MMSINNLGLLMLRNFNLYKILNEILMFYNNKDRKTIILNITILANHCIPSKLQNL